MSECVTGQIASEKPTIDIKSVISKAEQAFNGKYNGGITNRMTGGGTRRCLQATETGGMDEGWSDAMAEYVFETCFLRLYIDSLIEWFEQKSPTIADYIMGDYVTNNKNGIRAHSYSISPFVKFLLLLAASANMR